MKELVRIIKRLQIEEKLLTASWLCRQYNYERITIDDYIFIKDTIINDLKHSLKGNYNNVANPEFTIQLIISNLFYIHYENEIFDLLKSYNLDRDYFQIIRDLWVLIKYEGELYFEFVFKTGQKDYKPMTLEDFQSKLVYIIPVIESTCVGVHLEGCDYTSNMNQIVFDKIGNKWVER